MKQLLIRTSKLVLLLVGIELVLFMLMITLAMTDEPLLPVGTGIFYLLKYGMGFPLVIINQDYPFFLDSGKVSIALVIACVLVNNLLQALGILGILHVIKPS